MQAIPEYQTRLEEVIQKIRSYHPDPDLDLFRRAFEYARFHHEGQMRKSGEPYIGHPVEVAHITADLRLDVDSLCAALLHDTVEDTEATFDDVEKNFGPGIRFLVEGLTKISKLKFKSRAEAQAENIRKLIVAMSRDLRVVLIKLADRLHNIRTLEHMSEAGQRRISQETLDIYAPIANRLGIHWVKVELEDISFRYLHREAYYDLAERIQKTRSQREAYIAETCAILRDQTRKYGIDAEIQGRPKHFFSIYKKMKKSKIDFEQIYDVTAFRIIVPNRAQCYEAIGIVHDLWKPVPGRFKDYIAIPKPNGYQSLHTTVVGHMGERVEIQVRSEEMHHIAEFGVAAHWAYKEGQNVNANNRQFQWLKELVETQADIDDSREFYDSLKLDLFTDQVFVFTPDGDIKSLPKGSTPLDFAYAVHSEVGAHCVHAKVNGRVVNLRYELRNGDRVEIITRNDQHPREEWLDFVKSSKARNKIRQYIRTEKKVKAREVARQILSTELKKYGLRYESVVKSGDMDAAADLLKYQNADQMLVAVGYGKLQPTSIISKIVPPDTSKVAEQPPSTMRKFGEKLASLISRPKKTGVRIAGMDGEPMVTYARCCNPVQGEPIVGYVTRGRGIVVHRSSCPRVEHLEVDRQIEVEWNRLHGADAESNKRQVSVRVVCEDKPGLLADMSAAFSSRGVNIANANCRTKFDGLAHNIFDVIVSDVGQLREAMRQVRRVNGVVSVERIGA